MPMCSAAIARTSPWLSRMLIWPESASGGSKRMSVVLMSPSYPSRLTAKDVEPHWQGIECWRPGPKSGSAQCSVDNAIVLGLIPCLTTPRIAIGSVSTPAPFTTLVMMKSSTEMMKARMKPDRMPASSAAAARA